MTIFVIHKKINATPMTKGEYATLRGLEQPPDPATEGYLLESNDGSGDFLSWREKVEFEDSQDSLPEILLSRLITERKGLKTQVDKLTTMLGKGKPDTITTTSWELMGHQHNIMHHYMNTLTNHITYLRASNPIIFKGQVAQTSQRAIKTRVTP